MVLIDDVAIEDETDGHEATENDHETSGSCNETAVQMEGEGEEWLNYSAKGAKDGGKPVVYKYTLNWH